MQGALPIESRFMTVFDFFLNRGGWLLLFDLFALFEQGLYREIVGVGDYAISNDLMGFEIVEGSMPQHSF